ncbi:MAG: hypothetical protein ACLQJ0_04855 [Steroidobacteraceae bacterium]|jgi:hypothetical protein
MHALAAEPRTIGANPPITACRPHRTGADHGPLFSALTACGFAILVTAPIDKVRAADVDASAPPAAATARPVPDGVAVIFELTRLTGKISLTSEKGEDLVAVVTGTADHLDGLRKNAFGYGESQDLKARCLLVSTHPDPTKPGSEWRHWLLCGQSPVLVLAPETPPDGMNGLVKRLRHETAGRTMPAYFRHAILGDALILQTEGGDSALYFSKNGPIWTELPGGD